jgi:hypothetical protein
MFSPRSVGTTMAGFVLLAHVACGAGDDDGSNSGTGDPDRASTSTLGSEAGSPGGEDGDFEPGAPNAGPGATVAGDGGAGLCVGAAADPSAAATVSGFIDKLPSSKPTGAARAEIVDAIIKSCQMFGPPSTNAGWQRQHCWAHLVSAIHKESSYNATVAVKDAYATRTIGTAKANDPTVGLLQIRFSSTVHDYVSRGPLESLSCVGCTFPASVISHANDAGSSSYWGVTGPTQNLALMQSAACNIGLGAWYYYVYATANGKASAATQLGAYCSGQGTAANLVTGLLSHLLGPDRGKGVIPDMNGVNALKSKDATAYGYVNGIKTLFDTMIAPAGGVHPFFVPLAPRASQYCR